MHKVLTILAISLLFGSIATPALAQSDDKLVVLHTTQGNIVIEFFPSDAPHHVDNFIKLTESGFYDNTVFHRIIPGFMIQGGDPKTKPDSGASQAEWGTGGPDTLLDAEFNTIKHNRGIVSMARAADPNSAGSQFFIVHQNSNFLDEQYTAFGRIITQESFDTLDKIASVPTTTNDIPVNPDRVTVTFAETIPRSEVPNLLDLEDPERTGSSDAQSQESQTYENQELGVMFSAPAGWILQEPPSSEEGAPNVVAVGPKSGTSPPIISLTINDHDGESIDDYIQDQEELLQPSIDAGDLEIISQEKKLVNGKDAFETNAQGSFQNTSNVNVNVQFRQVTIHTPDKFYVFSYSNDENYFDGHLPHFTESVESFELLSENDAQDFGPGGGCLIATAAYGSELAPEIQQLRELRDSTLMQTESGSSFVDGFNTLYYSFSPAIADLERQNLIFKEAVRLAITPMIASLSILNHVSMDSEPEVLGYGIGIITMNIGMYFVLPAAIIHRIRR